MHPGDRFRDRVRNAIAGAIITLIATVGGRLLAVSNEATSSSELSVTLIIVLLQSFPGLMTLAGIAGATVIAGPFGFIGAILEIIGASQLLNPDTPPGIGLIVFGAVLVTIGAMIPWRTVLAELLE